MVGWSQGELAARAGVAKNTVYLFEAGQRSPIENVLAALRRALEAEGIGLVFDDTGALLASSVRVFVSTCQEPGPINRETERCVGSGRSCLECCSPQPR